MNIKNLSYDDFIYDFIYEIMKHFEPSIQFSDFDVIVYPLCTITILVFTLGKIREYSKANYTLASRVGFTKGQLLY
jgi:hypothetical protein